MGCAHSDKGHLLPTTQKLSRRRRGQLVFVGGLCTGQPLGSSILEQEAGTVSAHTVNIRARTKGSLCQFPEPDRGGRLGQSSWFWNTGSLTLPGPCQQYTFTRDFIHSPPFVTPPRRLDQSAEGQIPQQDSSLEYRQLSSCVLTWWPLSFVQGYSVMEPPLTTSCKLSHCFKGSKE